MTIIFDLDGTLIDSSERMYRLFQKLVPQSQFSKEQYWELKRDKINHKMILERYFEEIDFYCFNEKWLKQIELEKYLKMDEPFYDTEDVLKALRANSISLILLTARQSKERLLEELERMDILKYFNLVLTTEGIKSKELLLRDSISEGKIKRSNNDLFISDMGKDILLGREYGYYTIAITHGFMNAKRLLEYEPNKIIDNLSDILYFISKDDTREI